MTIMKTTIMDHIDKKKNDDDYDLFSLNYILVTIAPVWDFIENCDVCENVVLNVDFLIFS